MMTGGNLQVDPGLVVYTELYLNNFPVESSEWFQEHHMRVSCNI